MCLRPAQPCHLGGPGLHGAGGHPPHTPAAGNTGQVSGQVVRAAALAVPSPASSRPPGLRWSGPTPPQLWRIGGAMGTAAAEGCGGRDHQKGFGWGDGLMPVLCPEGSLTPPAAQGAGKQGSTRWGEPTLQPLQAVLLQKAPTGLISLLNTRMRSAMPLFPCTHVGRQALLSQSQRLTEGQHWSCAPASPSAYLPVSAEVPISGAAQHPQHLHRKVNTIV